MKKYLLSVLAFISFVLLFNPVSGNNWLSQSLVTNPGISEYVSTSLLPQSQELLKYRAPREINEAIKSMLASDNPAIVSEGKRLQSLVQDKQPKLYLKNGVEKLAGENAPKVIDTDVASLRKLYETNSLYNQVEIIVVHIHNNNDLSALLDIESLLSLSALKYIYFLSDIPICSGSGCEPDRIATMVKGNETQNHLILFEISVLQ